MIDCHAHAFPTLEDALARVSPHAAHAFRGIGDRVKAGIEGLPFARGRAELAELLSTALDKTAFDVEQVANLRRTNARVKQLEPVLALASLPQLAHGASPAKLLESMERNGVERTVLIAAEPMAPNEWVLEHARQAGGKLVPVVNIPRMDAKATDAQWFDAFTELAEGGARGFKIHLNMDGVGATHRAYRALFEAARAHDLFVIVHTGCFHVPGYKLAEAAEPRLFDPLFEDFRDVRVCLAHMNRDDPERAWETMRRFDQVWTDTSWQPADAIARAVDQIGEGRLLLGSDWPLLHADLQGDVLRILRHALGDARAERVGTENARAFLGE
jgi:predicted TIM-barrel fold metal-dependent hydrolase